MNPPPNKPQEWMRSGEDEEPLRRYLQAIRERVWFLVLALIVTTAAAAAYVATAEKVYEAQVDVVVSPIQDPEGSLSSLPVITGSNDPLRAVETAATLLLNNVAAERTAAELGLDRSSQSILRDITAEPVAESDIVTITARANSAQGAADLADTYAATALGVRDEEVRAAIDAELPALRKRVEQAPEGIASETLAAQLAELESLSVGGDPTLRLVEPALVPGAPVSPRPIPSILAGILAGLVLGLGAIFALRMLDPRLRREEQIRERFKLPILARVPKERRVKDRPLIWKDLPPGSVEAYRTLRAILSGSRGGRNGAHSILITSAGPGEGKTTSALALASSLALTSQDVILIEGDLRRPTLAKALGIQVDQGMTSVLLGDSTLDESLYHVPGGDGHLKLLLAEEGTGAGAELLALPTAQRLLAEAKKVADVVVIDSPPLATVVDALPLARAVDDVVLTVKLGTSRVDRVQELAEILADSDITPAGFALIGVAARPDTYYVEAAKRRSLIRLPDAEPQARSG